MNPTCLTSVPYFGVLQSQAAPIIRFSQALELKIFKIDLTGSWGDKKKVKTQISGSDITEN